MKAPSVAILLCAINGIIGSLAFTNNNIVAPSVTSRISRASQSQCPLSLLLATTNDEHHHQQQQQQSFSSSSSRRQWLASVATAVTAGTSMMVYSPPALAATSALKPTASLCDPTVSIWERNGRTVYLLGTAHISETSASLAGELVRDTHPDAVFVELDLKRIGGTGTMAKRMEAKETAMSIEAGGDDDQPKTKPTRVMISPVGRQAAAALESSSTAVAAVSTTADPSTASQAAPVETTEAPLVPADNAKTSEKGGGFFQNLGAAAVGNGIKGLYSKLGNEGFNPGEEFVVAIREGQKQGAAVVLGDQDVDMTLRRMATALQQTDLSRLMSSDSSLEQSMREMTAGSSSATNSDAAAGASEQDAFRSDFSTYVETIKTKDNVKHIMGVMKQEAPALYQVMVTERDAYMAAGLNTLNEFAIITAVMGLAHIDGVENNLRKEGWKAVPVRCPVKA